MSCQRSSSSRARLREDRDGAASRPRRSGSIVPRSPSLSLPIRTWRWLSSMARCDRRMAVGARDPRRRQARRRRRCRCRSLHPHRASQADLTAAGWPATGRVVRLALMPMSARAGELHRRRRTVAANVRRPDGECAPRTSSGRHHRSRSSVPFGAVCREPRWQRPRPVDNVGWRVTSISLSLATCRWPEVGEIRCDSGGTCGRSRRTWPARSN